jgi:HK97 family phage major capsid protein
MRTASGITIPDWSPLDPRTGLSILKVDGHPHYVLPPKVEGQQPLLVPMLAGGAYDNLVSRTDAQATIPEDVADSIIGSLPEQSAALSLFARRTMARGQTRLPVLAALPIAYFVNGDTGLKQTSEGAWDNVYLYAEEIAVIVPIPDAVLEDSSYDLFGELEPWLREAIGRTLDGAIFFGVNKPASWPTAIVPAAISAGNVVVRGTATTEQGGIAEDVNNLMGEVEDDGYDVNGFVTARTFRRRLRGARNAQGDKLADLTQNEIEGSPVRYAMTGLWPVQGSAPSSPGVAELIAGDFQQGIVGIRRDITMDRSNQAVIQDGTGAIVYNLFQQDMTAVRVTFRAGFAVPNPINRAQAVAGDRYPFGVMVGPDLPA